MQYFNTLPKVLYTDAGGNSSIYTNLISRSSIIPKILKNPMTYYTYDIQEGDTPEIIAHKYYNDIYRYWVVLFANQILDPQWDWPLSYKNFNDYISTKYVAFNPKNTTHHYEKKITQHDLGTNTITEKIVNISEEDYMDLFESTNTYSLPTGNVVVTIQKSAVSYYDYELKKNESKRNIKLLNSIYVDQLENEFKILFK